LAAPPHAPRPTTRHHAGPREGTRGATANPPPHRPHKGTARRRFRALQIARVATHTAAATPRSRGDAPDRSKCTPHVVKEPARVARP